MPNSTFYYVSRQLQTNQSVSKGRISVTGLNARGGTPGLYETNGPGKSRKIKGDAARSAGRVDEPGSLYGRLFGRRQVVYVSVFFPHRALTLLRHQRITGLSSTMSNPPKYPRCLAQAASLPTRPHRGTLKGLSTSSLLRWARRTRQWCACVHAAFHAQGYDHLPAEHVCIYGHGMRSLRRARNLCHFSLPHLFAGPSDKPHPKLDPISPCYDGSRFGSVHVLLPRIYAGYAEERRDEPERET
jgi:hypothetical protein